MELHEPETTDIEWIRELIESTLTASYALSPQQIETLLEDDFDRERLESAFNSSDAITLVADSTINGGENHDRGHY